jgi:hypothetical protein
VRRLEALYVYSFVLMVFPIAFGILLSLCLSFQEYREKHSGGVTIEMPSADSTSESSSFRDDDDGDERQPVTEAEVFDPRLNRSGEITATARVMEVERGPDAVCSRVQQ